MPYRQFLLQKKANEVVLHNTINAYYSYIILVNLKTDLRNIH